MLNIVLIVTAIVGFFISLYAYYVECKIKKDASYKPACDINDRISCSKPLTCKYSNLFFISNSVAGMAYYCAVIVAALLQKHDIVMGFTTLGFIATLYLAYILYFKVQSFCLVCSSLYMINILLLIFAVY